MADSPVHLRSGSPRPCSVLCCLALGTHVGQGPDDIQAWAVGRGPRPLAAQFLQIIPGAHWRGHFKVVAPPSGGPWGPRVGRGHACQGPAQETLLCSSDDFTVPAADTQGRLFRGYRLREDTGAGRRDLLEPLGSSSQDTWSLVTWLLGSAPVLRSSPPPRCRVMSSRVACGLS